MGYVFVDARVFGRRSAKIRFLVDTGSTYAVIPVALADRLDLPHLPRRFRVKLADGRVKALPASTMGIELLGRTAPATVVLVPDGEPLLGVETLEGLGLRVNPSKERLEASRANAVLAVRGREPER